MLALLSPFVALFLAGVLIGHLVSYRDHARFKQRIDHLQGRYDQARRLAKKRRGDLEKSVAGIEQDLAAETRRSESLVDQLREVLQQRAAAEQEADRVQRGLRSELHSARQSAQPSVVQDEATIESLRRQVEIAAGDYIEVNQSLKQTQQDLVARCRDLDAIRADRDAISQELQQTIERAIRIESDCEDKLRAQRGEIETLRTALHSYDALRADHLETSERLSEASQICQDLRARLERAESEVAKLRGGDEDQADHRRAA